MPPIFKALALITAGILFVFGCLALRGGFGRIIGARHWNFKTGGSVTNNGLFWIWSRRPCPLRSCHETQVNARIRRYPYLSPIFDYSDTGHNFRS